MPDALLGLAAQWRRRAKQLRENGLGPGASAFEQAAGELEDWVREAVQWYAPTHTSDHKEVA